VRNAVAHSGCGRIEVSVDVDDAEFRGRVEDDGKGFDPHGGEGVWHDDRGDGEPAAGVGLRSMRERTDALGGLLDVSSEPGRGSALEVCIPLADRPLFTEPRRRGIIGNSYAVTCIGSARWVYQAARPHL
jgi:signal transduction histidine kinase